jgi:hypothetical protein
MIRDTKIIVVCRHGLTSAAWADQAVDLARLHTEAIGGAARIAQFSALQATGTVRIGERTMHIGLVAQRPNRVRTIVQAEGYMLIQAYDGVNPPWQIDASAKSSGPQLIGEAAAHDFINDAEFDDPLVSPSERGYSIDYAGTTEVNGKRIFRLLVTHRLTETFELELDGDTYFIIRRLSTRELADGREVKLETRYADFRPVAGVIVPFRVGVYVGDRLLNETVLESVEANPPLEAAVFSRPATPEVKTEK